LVELPAEFEVEERRGEVIDMRIEGTKDSEDSEKGREVVEREIDFRADLEVLQGLWEVVERVRKMVGEV